MTRIGRNLPEVAIHNHGGGPFASFAAKKLTAGGRFG